MDAHEVFAYSLVSRTHCVGISYCSGGGGSGADRMCGDTNSDGIDNDGEEGEDEEEADEEENEDVDDGDTADEGKDDGTVLMVMILTIGI